MRCEGAPKVSKAFASFNINFLLVSMSIKALENHVGNRRRKTSCKPSTFFVMIDAFLCGCRMKDISEKVLEALRPGASLGLEGWKGFKTGRKGCPIRTTSLLRTIACLKIIWPKVKKSSARTVIMVIVLVR